MEKADTMLEGKDTIEGNASYAAWKKNQRSLKSIAIFKARCQL